MARVIRAIIITLGILYSNQAAMAATVQVAKVVDGDTFEDRNHQKIRMIGIDTPELGHGFRADEPLARQATAATTKLLTGQTLTLTPGPQARDHYGRNLARVQLADGRDVAEILLARGLAMVMIYPPNIAQIPHYLQVEAKARKLGIGIWQPANSHLLAAQNAALGRNHYRLVTGKVVAMDHTKKYLILHLNTPNAPDFSVRISQKNWKNFFAPHGVTEKSLTGKRVMVRGKIHGNSRLSVTITHPLQLQWL